MSIVGPKRWDVNSLGKISILQLFEVLVFIAQKGVFLLEYRKTHFPGLYRLKKKVGKMAIFGQKPIVNPFGIISIFRLFEPLVSITQKGVFFVVDCRKTHFPGLFCLKEKLERWLFLDQNHELPLWKHLNFSSFLFPCFYSLEEGFFVLEYRKTHFPGLYCLKKEKFQNADF